ncbi:MAG: hypothetical protein GY750_19020 [Lentisphaerae bacterium]|nr:hypothetical protein [Lentisphaerota bacterium]MCP4103491.1 hypothetical protein [Lentisphaerota bacterium]
MSEIEENTAASPCSFCSGTLCLSQYGIFQIFLMAAKLPLLLIVIGITAALIYSKYFYIIAVFGFIIPLARADFRLYLYPVTAICCLLDKKVNCPRCNPHGSVFRR